MRKIQIYKFAVLLVTAFFAIRNVVPFFTEKSNNLPVYQESVYTLSTDFEAAIPQVSAESAIVIDAKTGNVIYSKNADTPRGMASTTKIMTALVAIENIDVNREFPVPKEAVGIEGSSVYLVEGEPLTIKELLYCLLLESGNDAATAIAICCAGNEKAFVDMMNAKAKEMELEYSHFSNPHGLNDPLHKTTARELALITAEAMEYPLFREIVACKTAKVRYNGNKNGRLLTNHNKLLFGFEGAIGVKTGYTRADGKCLVSAAERDNLRLIAVTLSDPNATNTHKTLLNNAFENFESRLIAAKGEIQTYVPINNKKGEFALCCNMEDIYLCLPKNAKHELEISVYENLETPIEANVCGANVVCRYNGNEIYIIKLETTKEIK